MNPVGGLVYYISAPESLAAAAANPLHTLFYVAFMLGSEYAGPRVQCSVGYCKVATLCAARCMPLDVIDCKPAFRGWSGRDSLPFAPHLPSRSLRPVLHHLD